jgi:hypothetical protein
MEQMSTLTQPEIPALADLPSALRWRSWPLVERPTLAWAGVGVLLAISIAVGFVAASLATGGLAFAALLLSVWRSMVPVDFELGPDGITQTILGRKRHLRWREFGVVRTGPRGLLLLLTDQPTAFDVLRGVYVPWGKHRDTIQAIIQHQFPTTVWS